MHRRIRAAIAASAVTLAVAGGVSVASVAPANADAATCISTLTEQGKDTTVRNEICQGIETLGDTLSEEMALSLCQTLMTVTALPPAEAADACFLAVAP